MRFLISTLLFTSSILAFVFFSLPLFKEDNLLRLRLQNFNKYTANIKSIMDVTDKIMAEYNSIDNEDLEKINKILPPSVEESKTISFISQLANLHGLLLKKIEISLDDNAPVKFGYFEKEKIFKGLLNIEVAGPYKNFLSFIDDLGNNLKLTNIYEINFNSSKIDSYEYKINSRIFYYPFDSKKYNIDLDNEEKRQKEILTILNTLEKIKIDSGFFNNESFRRLKGIVINNSSAEAGVENPFAPF